MEDTVIERIKIILADKNLSVNALAKKIGMGQVTLNQYIRGERKPSLKAIELIKNSFPEISADWLLTGEGEMYRPGFGPGGEKDTSYTENAVAKKSYDETNDTPVAKKSYTEGRPYFNVDFKGGTLLRYVRDTLFCVFLRFYGRFSVFISTLVYISLS